jgi:hypothetical protein
MDVLHMALDGWSVGRTRYPHVQILVTSCFEEDRVVAAVQVSEFVEEI